MSIRTTKKRLLSISTMMEDHHKTLMTKVLAPQPSKTRVLAMESLDLWSFHILQIVLSEWRRLRNLQEETTAFWHQLMLVREWEPTLPPVFLLVLIYTCIIAINCIIDIKCVICIISDPKSPGHTWADQLSSIWGPSEAVLIPSKCQRHFASRFAYDQHRRSKFLQGTPCFAAVDQLSELVATLRLRLRANLSTAVLQMASVSRAVGTKFCQWQN